MTDTVNYLHRLYLYWFESGRAPPIGYHRKDLVSYNKVKSFNKGQTLILFIISTSQHQINKGSNILKTFLALSLGSIIIYF